MNYSYCRQLRRHRLKAPYLLRVVSAIVRIKTIALMFNHNFNRTGNLQDNPVLSTKLQQQCCHSTIQMNIVMQSRTKPQNITPDIWDVSFFNFTELRMRMADWFILIFLWLYVFLYQKPGFRPGYAGVVPHVGLWAEHPSYPDRARSFSANHSSGCAGRSWWGSVLLLWSVIPLGVPLRLGALETGAVWFHRRELVIGCFSQVPWGFWCELLIPDVSVCASE